MLVAADPAENSRPPKFDSARRSSADECGAARRGETAPRAAMVRGLGGILGEIPPELGGIFLDPGPWDLGSGSRGSLLRSTHTSNATAVACGSHFHRFSSTVSKT